MAKAQLGPLFAKQPWSESPGTIGSQAPAEAEAGEALHPQVLCTDQLQ